MGSNNSKYSEEMRERTARHIIETGVSSTSMAEELGIYTNMVSRWVRDYRRKNKLPSYAESKGIKRSEPKSNAELMYRVKELEKEAKAREKELEAERTKVEILKKTLHIFMGPQG